MLCVACGQPAHASRMSGRVCRFAAALFNGVFRVLETITFARSR